MRNFYRILMIGLLLYMPIVNASLRTETDSMIARVESETAELNTALTSFKNYLNTNKTEVANALDIATLKQISSYLQASDYTHAFSLLESTLNDASLTNIGLASKINQYFTLKQDLISFINSNQAALNIDTCTTGCECSLDLLDQIKDSFDLVKPALSDTIEAIGTVFSDVIKKELINDANLESSEIEVLIEDYKELGSLLSALATKYVNSLDAYAEPFSVLGGSEGVFNATIKKKFREDLNKLLNDIDNSLDEPIDTYVAARRAKLEADIEEIVESDKTVQEKNEEIYEKIDQVTNINNKFVSAISEIIGDLDIESIKIKINDILERGNTEFASAKDYLMDNLVIGDYDIVLATNHDDEVSINRAKEILILDKLFDIEEFKRQIELANNLGTLTFQFGNYEKVPNGAIVSVADDNTTQKEYRVIVKGDVNGNANITVTDVAMTAYYALDSVELDEYQVMAADANGNNAVTVTDVNIIAMKALEGNE